MDLVSFLILITLALSVVFIKVQTVLTKRKAEELEKINEELNLENQDISKKLLGVLELSSKLSEPDISVEDYFSKVLDFALDFISPAEKGSIFIRKGDRWKAVAVVGHDAEVISRLKLTTENFLVPTSPTISRDLKEWHQTHDFPTDFKAWMESLGDIRETLIVPLKKNGEIFGVMNLDITYAGTSHFTDRDVQMAQRFAKMASAFHMMREYAKREGQFHRKVALTIVKALEYYDMYTRGHSERVARYSTLIAEKMGIDRKLIRRLYWAGLLHDIGKIFVPQAVLNKPTRLDETEYELVKVHPIKSEELIREIEEMEDIALWVRHHHERWDGRGYPDGLSGGDIPLLSRILVVADSLDAMTTERPYQKALNKREAMRELMENAGKQFDPKIVEVTIRLLEKMEGILDYKQHIVE